MVDAKEVYVMDSDFSIAFRQAYGLHRMRVAIAQAYVPETTLSEIPYPDEMGAVTTCCEASEIASDSERRHFWLAM